VAVSKPPLAAGDTRQPNARKSRRIAG